MPGHVVRPAFFYRKKTQKWQVLKFDDPLECYLTAIVYLRRGYTVGINEVCAGAIAVASPDEFGHLLARVASAALALEPKEDGSE